MQDIERDLFELRDLAYKEFHSRLMPTVNPDKIIGVRTPVLRCYAKTLLKTDIWQEFIKNSVHEYYEENNLHAFLIEGIKDFDKAVFETEKFLPYIDNWATCDMFSPKVFSKNKDKIIVKIYGWIKSDKPYTVRYSIGLLMKLFLEDEFKEEYMDIVAKVKSDEYYVNMMIAWYFATALAKQYNSAVLYLEKRKLDKWIHNKTISKALESYRIDDKTKKYVKTLKVKE